MLIVALRIYELSLVLAAQLATNSTSIQNILTWSR